MNQISRAEVRDHLDAALTAMEETSLDQWIAITQERARSRERRSTALGWMVNATMPEVRRQVHNPTVEYEELSKSVQAAFRRASKYCESLPETIELEGTTWRLRDEALGVTADLVRAVGNASFAVGDKKATDSLALLLKPFFRFPQYQPLKEIYGL